MAAAPPDHCGPLTRAYLGLGSNLGDPKQQLSRAIAAIAMLPECRTLGVSSFYQSPAWGSATPQPDYLNAVVTIETTLAPEQLLAATQRIETMQGRVRGAERNGARTLDIDLLLYGDRVQRSAFVELPHPRMHERAFVLLPLLEIAPEVVIPGRGAARQLLSALAIDDTRKLHENT